MTTRSGILKLSLVALAAVIWTAAPTQATGLIWKTLTLANGWKVYPGTRHPAYTIDANNFVHLRGGMFTAGTNAMAFTLPVGFRPNQNVYVVTVAINAKPAQLVITTEGIVNVQAGVNQTDVYNFTSLEGVNFVTR